MVVPILKGGLGNQMFQIANAFAYAKRHGFDWGINYNLSFCPNQGSTANKYRNTLYMNLPTTNITPSFRYVEHTFSYTEINPTNDILFDGYFQSEKYFLDYSDEVKKLFKFSNCECVEEFLEQFDKPVVGIHIRRGDYKKFESHHGIQKSDYYVRASKEFKNHQSVVCTDDWDSVMNEMSFSKAVKSPFINEEMDMYLLSHCSSVVMCNSSFSWWGAFLGVEKDKVIAPRNWFGMTGPKDFQDVYRENWICL